MYFSPALIAAFATIVYGANTNANTGNANAAAGNANAAASGTTGATGATGTGTATGAGTTYTVQVAPGNTLSYSPTMVNAAVGDTVMFAFSQGNHTVTAGAAGGQACTPGGAGFASGFVATTNNPTNPPTINGKLTGNAFVGNPTTGPNQGTAAATGNTGNANAGNANANQGSQGKNNKIRSAGDWVFVEGRAANGNPTFAVKVASTAPQPVYCNQQLHCQQGPMVMMINGNAAQLAAYQASAKTAQKNVIANGPTGGTLTGNPNQAGAATTNNNNGNAQAAQQAQQQQQQQQQAQQQAQQAQQQGQQAAAQGAQAAQQAKNNNKVRGLFNYFGY